MWARWWALAWLLVLGTAVAVTRNEPRTLFLLHPAVYLVAAAGAEWLGRLLAAATVGVLGRFSFGRLGSRLGCAIQWLPAIVLCALVARLVLADLVGDITLAKLWWD